MIGDKTHNGARVNAGILQHGTGPGNLYISENHIYLNNSAFTLKTMPCGSSSRLFGICLNGTGGMSIVRNNFLTFDDDGVSTNSTQENNCRAISFTASSGNTLPGMIEPMVQNGTHISGGVKTCFTSNLPLN
jgi:hypothetical protein